ncbi:MAG: hypothetical protein ACE5OS_05740 [Anaerolineae bacterium]
MNIYKTDVTFEDGRTIHFMYDRDSDDLEIVFERERANCTIELTEHIILRLDRERESALSLILVGFSSLTEPTEVGPRSFPMSNVDHLPADLRQTVFRIITTPPVNHFLKVSYFAPTPAERIPIAYVERPSVLATLT